MASSLWPLITTTGAGNISALSPSPWFKGVSSHSHASSSVVRNRDHRSGQRMVWCKARNDIEKIIDLKLPPGDSPMRVRPAPHLATEEYKAKYKKAIDLMKALPEDDPRSFKSQVIENQEILQLDQNSHILFIFNRYHLYIYEKFLGKLIGDPTFALPYWSWDTPAGMTIPGMFAEFGSPSLYDPKPKRNVDRFPAIVVDFEEPTSPVWERMAKNLSTTYRRVFSGGKSGGDESQWDPVLHTPLHGWPSLSEEMGNFYSDGRDFMFYGLHANVDRLFMSMENSMGGQLQDPEWVECLFGFYDENAQLVRIRVEDCPNPHSLGYTYQEIPIHD